MLNGSVLDRELTMERIERVNVCECSEDHDNKTPVLAVAQEEGFCTRLDADKHLVEG